MNDRNQNLNTKQVYNFKILCWYCNTFSIFNSDINTNVMYRPNSLNLVIECKKGEIYPSEDQDGGIKT